MLNALIIFIAFAVYIIKCNDSSEKRQKEKDMNEYFSDFKHEDIKPSYLIFNDTNNGNLMKKELKFNDSIENLLAKDKIENSNKLNIDKPNQGFVDIEL
jgi:hypothetical protein